MSMEKKKTGIGTLVMKILLVAFIMTAFCATGHILYRSYSTSTSNASYIDKLDRLEKLTVEGNKAVFVGGSATHFGVHSDLFEEKTGMPSVNMGLNAGVSFGLYIDSIRPYLKSGDVLFLTPEYGYYGEDWYNDTDNNVEFLLYYAPGTIKRTDAEVLLKYFPSAITVGWKNFGNYFSDMIRARLSKNEVYKRSSSNEYGDMTIHKDFSSVKFEDSEYTFLEYPFIEDLIKCVREFESEGVMVYLLFPPLNSTSFVSSEKCIGEIYNRLKESGVRLLFAPGDASYPNDDFFDTVYHLRYDSGKTYTEMIVDKYLEEKDMR